MVSPHANSSGDIPPGDIPPGDDSSAERGPTSWHSSTLAVAAGRDPSPGAPLNVPPTFASTYRDGGPLAYGRWGNPTWQALETALGALEKGSALIFSSGQAASAALLATVPPGGTVAVVDGAYLGTRSLVADHSPGLNVRLVPVSTQDQRDPDEILRRSHGADVLWLESPTNPLLDLLDLPRLLPLASAMGLRTVVDNTFATPILQQPLEWGAWAVSHSATKYIGGHSDLLLGAVVTRDVQGLESLLRHRTIVGSVPGTMEAYLALRGLRTLPVRIERSQATAGLLADRLRTHPQVSRVRYPGFGAMISFELPTAERAENALARLRLAVSGTSLGGVETTLDRRGRWPGEEAVPEGLIRVSVGLEHPEDLWQDLSAALGSDEALAQYQP